MHPDDDNAVNTEERIWDLTMNINLKGVWWGCKHAILAMRNNPTDEGKKLHVGGSIINVASFVAILGAATPQLACEYSRCSTTLMGDLLSTSQIPLRRCAVTSIRSMDVTSERSLSRVPSWPCPENWPWSTQEKVFA